jgi:hypothetical protein
MRVPDGPQRLPLCGAKGKCGERSGPQQMLREVAAMHR